MKILVLSTSSLNAMARIMNVLNAIRKVFIE